MPFTYTAPESNGIPANPTEAHFKERFAAADALGVQYPQMFTIDLDECGRSTSARSLLRLRCGTLFTVGAYSADRVDMDWLMAYRIRVFDPAGYVVIPGTNAARVRRQAIRQAIRKVVREYRAGSMLYGMPDSLFTGDYRSRNASKRATERQRVLLAIKYPQDYFDQENRYERMAKAVRGVISDLRDGVTSDFDQAASNNDLVGAAQALEDFDAISTDTLEKMNEAMNKHANWHGGLIDGHCGHMHLRSDSHAVGSRYDRQQVCDSCFQEDYVEMDDGRYMHRDDVHYWDSDGEYHYESEPEDDEDEDEDDSYGSRGNPERRMDYSTNVMGFLSIDPSFKTTATGDFHMGVELETILRRDAGIDVDDKVEEVREELGGDYLVAKYDGSLGNTRVSGDGIEWVTRPTSLATHISTLGGWDTSAKGLVAWDAGCCGMHVHIDSRAFTKSSLGKMLQFFNMEGNATFIRAIAGRHPDTDEQARSYARRDVQPEQATDPVKALKAKTGGERYCMINLTNLRRFEAERLGAPFSNGKYDTVELRIFRASMNKRRLLSQLEFTHAVVVFCRTAGYSKLTGLDFRKWLADPSNVSAYPRLAKFLNVQPNKHGAPLGAPRNTPAPVAQVETDELVPA